jgi:hypothetical protein
MLAGTTRTVFQWLSSTYMTTYFYRVDEFVTNFGKGQGPDESFSHSLDFHFDTVEESRRQAYDYYNERHELLAKEQAYFLPFAPTKDTHLGDIALYSLTLYFVECYNEDEYYLHGLEGVDDYEKTEARNVELEVLNL